MLIASKKIVSDLHHAICLGVVSVDFHRVEIEVRRTRPLEHLEGCKVTLFYLRLVDKLPLDLARPHYAFHLLDVLWFRPQF